MMFLIKANREVRQSRARLERSLIQHEIARGRFGVTLREVAASPEGLAFCFCAGALAGQMQSRIGLRKRLGRGIRNSVIAALAFRRAASTASDAMAPPG